MTFIDADSGEIEWLSSTELTTGTHTAVVCLTASTTTVAMTSLTLVSLWMRALRRSRQNANIMDSSLSAERTSLHIFSCFLRKWGYPECLMQFVRVYTSLSR